MTADLAGGPPRTPVGQLARGIQRRQRAGAPPLTILCCDNLVRNGTVLAGLVADFAAALPPPEGDLLADQLAAARFPSSMVDRIVPATEDADLAEAYQRLGVFDAAVVVAEPFLQWVIEPDFAGDVPDWAAAGAELTDEVATWEAVKLRMLNAAHSMLAYLGALMGYPTIADAVADDQLAAVVRSMLTSDAIPTLRAPRQVSLVEYADGVLERFANPALRHTTQQVAMDGSQKLPVRLLPTIRDRLDAGAEPRLASLAVAAWMAFVAYGRDAGGAELVLDDPLVDELRAAVAGREDPAAVVVGLLGVGQIFSDELADSAVFRDLLVEHLSTLVPRRG